MPKTLPLAALAAALLSLLVLPAVAPAAGKAKPKPPQKLYVSLGDSYATGYQPTAQGQGSNTRNGFAYQLPGLAKARGYNFKLVNFGCAGATSTSILESVGCVKQAQAIGGPKYPTKTQTAAAEAFLRANRSKLGLITVSIGGNDVTGCLKASDPTKCVADNVEVVKRNVTTLATRLRAAAGDKVPIVGITYPDVVLGLYTTHQDSDKQLADLSLFAFKQLINPGLKAGYTSVSKGRFVDITTATGAYTPLTQTITLVPYGTVPVAVAKVCRLTYFCQYRDIHARTSGYKIIAQQVVKTLPKLS